MMPGRRWPLRSHLRSGGNTPRLEVALGPGESVIEEPGVIVVEPSGLVANQRVALGGAGVVDQD